MQDYSYIFVSGMVLKNKEITSSSHNLIQLKNASRHFSVQHIPTKILIQHLFFASYLFFAFVKSALTILSAI